MLLLYGCFVDITHLQSQNSVIVVPDGGRRVLHKTHTVSVGYVDTTPSKNVCGRRHGTSKMTGLCWGDKELLTIPATHLVVDAEAVIWSDMKVNVDLRSGHWTGLSVGKGEMQDLGENWVKLVYG